MATVLVVDDDLALQGALAFYLERMGWSVLRAATVAEAVYVASKGRPDVILCDVLLPDGNGFDVLRRLREAGAHGAVPCVLLSGSHNQAKDVQQGLDGGGWGYLLKPVDLRLVDAKLRAVLRTKEDG